MSAQGGFNSEEDFGEPDELSRRQPSATQKDQDHSGTDALDVMGTGRQGGDGEGQDTAVFIGNLQWWTTDVELETTCSDYGNVSSIRFIEDKACGKSRGMAVIDFEDTEAASRCVKGLDGKEINGRPCKATYQSQRNQHGGQSSREFVRSAGGAGGSRALQGPHGRGGTRGMPGGGGRGVTGMGGGMLAYDEFQGPVVGDMMGMGMMGMPGMMGMGGMGMDMMGMGMMGGSMGMPPFGVQNPGMASSMGFKPPPPPGAPPKKEES